MAKIVGLVGHRMGGRPGEHLMHRLGMPVSDDTILRQLKRDNPASIQKDNLRVVGIDDWSWRHSSRYGTIMVDLERHSVVDVLDDRSVESAKAWLQERPLSKSLAEIAVAYMPRQPGRAHRRSAR